MYGNYTMILYIITSYTHYTRTKQLYNTRIDYNTTAHIIMLYADGLRCRSLLLVITIIMRVCKNRTISRSPSSAAVHIIIIIFWQKHRIIRRTLLHALCPRRTILLCAHGNNVTMYNIFTRRRR